MLVHMEDAVSLPLNPFKRAISYFKKSPLLVSRMKYLRYVTAVINLSLSLFLFLIRVIGWKDKEVLNSIRFGIDRSRRVTVKTAFVP